MGDRQTSDNMIDTAYQDRYCIIGAGSSGIAAAHHLRERGIPYDVIEREDDIGGNWYFGKPNSSVYRSTHLISSKPLTEYSDFPMPADYPDYPGHQQVLAYFHSYVNHFGLRDSITFNTEVVRAEPAGTGWYVTVRGPDGEESTRHYHGLIIANGHNWYPKYPDYPGTFTGETVHSGNYKTPHMLEGKRVLVIGAGNSGCDIAVESATHAARTIHSTRRAYYYMPKFFNGEPVDQIGERLLNLNVPLPVRRVIGNILYRVVVGDLRRYGLPKPDHKLFETHPIVNSQMPYFLGHGDITLKPDVARYDGNMVVFTDGSREEIDVIVYATGFRIVFPFMDTALLNWKNDHPNFFLNVFHPERDDLFIAGLIQPDSGQWGIVDCQCQLIARYIDAQKRNPKKAEWFRDMKRRGQESYSAGITYKESTRHYVEIEHHSYRKRVEKLVRQFG